MSRRRVLVAVLPALVAAAIAVPVVASATSTSVDTAATVSTATTADDSFASATAAAAASSAASSAVAAAVAAAASESAASSAAASAAVLAAVDAAAATADGTIAVVVLDADGDTLVASDSAATAEYTASLVKLLVVQQILQQFDPSDDDLELMASAIEASDDDAMNSLWVAYDGDALVTAAAEVFGLTGTAGPDEAGQWGESTTTAADYATVLAEYADHLSTADAALLTSWLQGTSATAADGFDQTFGVVSLDLDGTAAKQGWMCCVSSTRQLHSAGVLADGRVVVLLGSFSSSTTWAQARAALDAAAAAVIAGT